MLGRRDHVWHHTVSPDNGSTTMLRSRTIARPMARSPDAVYPPAMVFVHPSAAGVVCFSCERSAHAHVDLRRGNRLHGAPAMTFALCLGCAGELDAGLQAVAELPAPAPRNLTDPEHQAALRSDAPKVR